MNNNSLSTNKKIALTGAFSALIIVLGITRLGMISISPTISLTIMHIPVLLAAMIAGLGGGITTGAVFGIFSLILAATSPTGALDPLFVNPLCSVLPRILLGVVVWALFVLFTKIIPLPKSIAAFITAFVSTLVHTCLVIGSLYLIYHEQMFTGMGNKGYFAGLLLLMPNALLEATAAAIICTAVFATISISSKQKSKLSAEETE